MKKLKIFEVLSNADDTLTDTVSVSGNYGDAVARWNWGADFPYSDCLYFFNKHQDIIMKLETPLMGSNEAARLFLIGCSLGHAFAKTEDYLWPDDILKITLKNNNGFPYPYEALDGDPFDIDMKDVSSK